MRHATGIPLVPPEKSLETPKVLRELIHAHRYLAELKGVAKTIPNETILISTLALQEAQNSSAIENIITTHDALYKYQLNPEMLDPITKETAHYGDALIFGYNQVKENQAITLNMILDIQKILVSNTAGFRKTPGTTLKNEQTGDVVFEPPSPEQLPSLLDALERYINKAVKNSNPDPLVRMALIHHRFETIHPFYDGNGRTGRIINILFLVKEGLLDTPILYLSRYINQNKPDYYHLLQAARDSAKLEEWLIFVLRGVSLTAQHTTRLVERIRDLFHQHKHHIREEHKFYSQDLINNLFRHPYTKVAFLEHDLKVSRATATRYLNALSKDGLLHKQKLGRENYYINHRLVELLFNLPSIKLKS